MIWPLLTFPTGISHAISGENMAKVVTNKFVAGVEDIWLGHKQKYFLLISKEECPEVSRVIIGKDLGQRSSKIT